jgi:hypothetical protein
MIEDGQKLIDQLSRSGFEMAAAFWLKPTEGGGWRFYIVSPLADREGLRAAFAQVHPVLKAMSPPFGISPLDVWLLEASSPLAKDILNLYKSAHSSRGRPIQCGDVWLGRMNVDEAYLYPLPASVP